MTPSHSPWEIAEAVISVSRRVLLRGKPGTGKTYTAVHSGLGEDQKVYQITMTPETPMAEIRGHFIQKGGDFIWHDGPAIAAWREGARLVINEIDRASEDVHSFLFAIMDDPEFAETTLPTGEIIQPSKGFQIIATMNGEPDDLPDALQDRLPVDIHITDLHPDALARLPEDLQEAARNSALAPSEERSISIRLWMEYASLREHVDPIVAAYAIFGDRAGPALIALKVGETASPAIYADGKEISEDALKTAGSVLKWAETQIDNFGNGPEIVDSIIFQAQRWYAKYNAEGMEKSDVADRPNDEDIRAIYRDGGVLYLIVDGHNYYAGDFS